MRKTKPRAKAPVWPPATARREFEKTWKGPIEELNARYETLDRDIETLLEDCKVPHEVPHDDGAFVIRKLEPSFLRYAINQLMQQLPTEKRPAKRPPQLKARGSRIRELRENINLTQERMAYLAGVELRSYQRIEAGAPTTRKHMKAVVEVLKREYKLAFDLSDFYEGTGWTLLPTAVYHGWLLGLPEDAGMRYPWRAFTKREAVTVTEWFPSSNDADEAWRDQSDMPEKDWKLNLDRRGFSGYPPREGMERWDLGNFG